VHGQVPGGEWCTVATADVPPLVLYQPACSFQPFLVSLLFDCLVLFFAVPTHTHLSSLPFMCFPTHPPPLCRVGVAECHAPPWSVYLRVELRCLSENEYEEKKNLSSGDSDAAGLCCRDGALA
jgi:hypothetical protein